jgi:hypothetical protein
MPTVRAETGQDSIFLRHYVPHRGEIARKGVGGEKEKEAAGLFRRYGLLT